MSKIPVHAFAIFTMVKHGEHLRMERRNAENLSQAMVIRDRELLKPQVRRVEVHLIIDQSDRRGGV